MTALSWIFGKKKEEKPIPVTVEAVEIGSDEDYAIIQAQSRQHGIYPQVPSAYPYTPLPYPILPRHQESQQPVGSAGGARPGVQNQLEGVPFVLSPRLDQSKSPADGLEHLRRAVFQIAADINDPEFDYNFQLEHNILSEALVYNHTN